MTQHHLASSPKTGWVVGLDAALPTASDADHVALGLADALHGSAGDPGGGPVAEPGDGPGPGVARDTGLVVLTHLVPAPGGFSSHLSLSVAGSGWQEDVVRLGLDLLLRASAAESAAEIGLATADATTGLPGLAAGAAHARGEHLGGGSGRAVVFPGSAGVGAETTVAGLLAATAIAEVNVLGGPAPAPDDVVVTREHLRPRLEGGRLVLDVQPMNGGRLVPFENPHPTSCCADH